MSVVHCIYHPPPLLDFLSLIILFISLYLFIFPGKYFNYLPSWNIWMGGFIWFFAPTSQICINTWTFIDSNCRTSDNKYIPFSHSYTSPLLRLIPRLTYPLSTSFLLPPFSPRILFVVSFQNPRKVSLVWIWLNPPNAPLHPTPPTFFMTLSIKNFSHHISQ